MFNNVDLRFIVTLHYPLLIIQLGPREGETLERMIASRRNQRHFMGEGRRLAQKENRKEGEREGYGRLSMAIVQDVLNS